MKKTDILTIRIAPETKKKLTEAAQSIGWTASKLADQIITDWTNKKEEQGGSIQINIGNNHTLNINGS